MVPPPPMRLPSAILAFRYDGGSGVVGAVAGVGSGAPLPRAALAMSRSTRNEVFSTSALTERLRQLVDVDPDDVIEDFSDAEAIAEVEVLVTGWGCPLIDEGILERAPRLRAVVHTAGTVKGIVSSACWERAITVSSATEANAVPVAEYTVAAIL